MLHDRRAMEADKDGSQAAGRDFERQHTALVMSGRFARQHVSATCKFLGLWQVWPGLGTLEYATIGELLALG